MRRTFLTKNSSSLSPDASEKGWEVASEYQRRDPTVNSDDDKRSKTPVRLIGEKESVLALSEIICSLPVSPLPNVIPSYGSVVPPFHPTASPSGFNPQNLFGAVNWSKSLRGSREGSCFNCRNFGHFRNQCPVLQAQFSANQPNKRS